jgi:sarcosine oxidase
MVGRSHDVIVVGLGGMGSAAAYRLARRGRRVLGLDRFGPVHNHGSSHGSSRLFRQVCWEDPAYVPLVRRAYELWRELEQQADERLLLPTGGLFLGPPECAMIRDGRVVAIAEAIPHELLSAAEIRGRYPTLAPDDDVLGLFDPTAGVLRPELAVGAQLRLAEAAGADLHVHEPVKSWSVNTAGGVSVITERATYRGDRLVICPGAWVPLLGSNGVPLAPQRLVVTRFQPLDGIAPFLPDRHRSGSGISVMVASTASQGSSTEPPLWMDRMAG